MSRHIRRSAAAGGSASSSPVTVDIITTPGGSRALASLQRKAAQADSMFTALVKHMNDALTVARSATYGKDTEVPSWVR